VQHLLTTRVAARACYPLTPSIFDLRSLLQILRDHEISSESEGIRRLQVSTSLRSVVHLVDCKDTWRIGNIVNGCNHVRHEQSGLSECDVKSEDIEGGKSIVR
jgi:hypothetical protein